LYKEGKLASKKETEEFFNKNKPKETIKETPKESTPKKGVKK
jgi:hypothetical protein